MNTSTKENASITADSSGNERSLITVICRTVNRPVLADALRSVARQTHRPVELKIVDAIGDGLVDVREYCADVPVQVISTGQPLTRPQAANQGLDAASGEFILFLDDDDWISPEHLSQLLVCMHENPQAGVVYSSAQKTDAAGIAIDYTFRFDFNAARLRRDNFIPIHTALFRTSLLDNGCRFDESLEIFEDWDFWLQLSTRTKFVHLDSITAWYRQGGDSSTETTAADLRYQAEHPMAIGREKLFAKWLPIWTGAQLNQTFRSLDQPEVMEALHGEIRTLNQSLSKLNQKAQNDIHQLNQQNEKAHREIHQLNLLNQKVHNEFHQLNLQNQEAQNRVHLLNQQILEANNQIQQLGQLNREAHNKLRQLSLSLNKTEQSLARKVGELEEAKAHINRLELDLQAIISSFSWRMTQPYRSLRMRFDNTVTHPLRRKLAPPPKVQMLQQSQAADPQIIYCNLDIPNEAQKEFAGQVTVIGWCCAPEGIQQIEARIDGQLHSTFQTGNARPDIAEVYPQISDAATAGFYQELALPDLPTGPHLLEIHISDNAGNSALLSSTFTLFKNSDLYNSWYWRNRPDGVQLESFRAAANAATDSPHFLLLVPSSPDSEALIATLSSIKEQCYSKWTVCIIGSTSKDLQGVIDLSGMQLGIDVEFVDTLELSLAQPKPVASLIGSLHSGETLAPHALWKLAQCALDTGADLIYSDHDGYTDSVAHLEPCLTPEWSPEHLLSANYVGGFFVSSLLPDSAGDLLDINNPAWRFACLLAISERAESVQRVPEVLWSMPVDAVLSTSVPQLEAEVIEKTFARQGKRATVAINAAGIRQVRWLLDSSPLVSIIIPTTGKLTLLEPCLDSLLDLTSYPNYEIIMLDNSRGKNPKGIEYLRSKQLQVIECNEAFNWSRLNNIGARQARGELLLFLNDDIEITDGNWLEELVRQAVRPEIGAVGAKLLYPNGALQHTGVLLVNYGGGAVHLLHKRMPGHTIYRHLHETTREVSASTGACLMVSASKYKQINGFDEELTVVGNDVDFCLRLLEQGYRNVWTPLCTLIHHESISRKTSVPKVNEKAMWLRWGKRFTAGDNYYNPNLSQGKADFSLDVRNITTISVPASQTAATELDSTQPKPLLPGVNLIGYLRAEMGIGEGARSDAKALDAAKEPFGIINFMSGNPSRMTDLSWQHKELNDAPYDINILHINPDHALQAITELPAEFFERRYIIGYWAWELPEIPVEWEATFKHMDEIWVPSTFVQQAVASKSPVPVVRIPHAIDVKVDTSLTRRDLDLPENAFIFLSMFDTYSMAARKNPFGAFNAFKQAFAPDDMSVRLILKVNNATPESMREVRAQIANYKNIVLLEDIFSRSELNALIANIDCYVSLHRAEGFGLGPAEAMSLGKVAIITNWSGNTDYMTANNCIGVNAELVTIDRDYGPYKAGQVWAEPDIAQAATAMQKLVADPAWAAELGRNARATMREKFSAEYVGKLMRSRLASIRARR